MGRLLARFSCALLGLIVGCASSTTREDVPQDLLEIPADAVVLRVSVKRAEFTDIAPCCGRSLFGAPFDYWYRYTAQVKSVVRGQYSGKTVSFLHAQHAEYIRAVTEDCYVVLVPAESEVSEMLDTDLVAVKLYSPGVKAHREAVRALGDEI